MVSIPFPIRLAIAAVACLLLAGCGQYEWHQKMTVTVDTPEGRVTASSVLSAKLLDARGMLADGRRVNYLLTGGEAVVLELGPGRYLFALLKGVPALNWLVYPKMDPAQAGELLENGNDGGAGEVTLDSRHFPILDPLLVTFGDINNPASVQRVDPTNLEATFGPGYRLNSITLSLTDEPVTRGGVEKVLPLEFFQQWAALYHGALSQGGIKNPFFKTLAASLGRNDFIDE